MKLTPRQKEKRRLIAGEVNKIKRSFGCMICGANDTGTVLTFHHTNCKTKKATVCRMVSRLKPLHVIEKEMMKCAIVCEPCHKEIHRGSSK